MAPHTYDNDVVQVQSNDTDPGRPFFTFDPEEDDITLISTWPDGLRSWFHFETGVSEIFGSEMTDWAKENGYDFKDVMTDVELYNSFQKTLLGKTKGIETGDSDFGAAMNPILSGKKKGKLLVTIYSRDRTADGTLKVVFQGIARNEKHANRIVKRQLKKLRRKAGGVMAFPDGSGDERTGLPTDGAPIEGLPERP